MGVASGSVWTGVFIYNEVENAKNKKKEKSIVSGLSPMLEPWLLIFIQQNRWFVFDCDSLFRKFICR